MTDTKERIDLDFSLLDKLENERVCTPWGGVDCGEQADWLVVAKCCAIEMPLCDRHLQMSVRFIKNSRKRKDCTAITCKNCGHDKKRSRWLKWSDFFTATRIS